MTLFEKNNASKSDAKQSVSGDVISGKTAKRTFCFFAVAIFISIFVIVFVGNVRADKINDAVNAVKDKVAVMQKDVDALSAKKIATESDVIKTANSAAVSGQKIAELQNNYNKYDIQTQMDDIKQNAQEIDKYIGGVEKNARTPWYSSQNAETPVKWEFESTYSFDGNTANVIWLCKDAKQHVYAYTTAVYDAKRNVFTHIHHNNTSFGVRRMHATVENKNKTHLDALISKIQKNAGKDSSENKFSAQDREKINEARQKLREKQMHAN